MRLGREAVEAIQTFEVGLATELQDTAILKENEKTGIQDPSLQNVFLRGDVVHCNGRLKFSNPRKALSGSWFVGKLSSAFPYPSAGDKLHLRIEVFLDGEIPGRRDHFCPHLATHLAPLSRPVRLCDSGRCDREDPYFYSLAFNPLEA
jgi:hypothetical protein